MAIDLSKITEESTSKTIDANGIRIHYHDIGEGDPIIAIHGGGPGANAWSNFKFNIEGLAANNRLIMFDMPGWGRSEYPAGAEKHEFISWCGNVLKDFMDALGLDKVDIIGNSMGGQAAMGLCIANPERVKHLVMIGSQPTEAIMFQPTPQPCLNNIWNYYGGEGPTKEKMWNVLRTLVHDQSLVTEELVEQRFKWATDPQAVADQARWVKQPRNDWYMDMPKNKVPTLLIWGHEDRGGALEVGLLMLKRFQHSRMYIISGCGHWAQVEHPEEFNNACLNWFGTETKVVAPSRLS